MKKYLVFLIIIFISSNLIAQEFAPIGAEWYYTEKFSYSNDIDYIKFTAEKDTIINGRLCKEITKRHQAECNGRQNKEYLYSSNDTVFFLDTELNDFQILYVFSAKSGDSWDIEVKDGEVDIDTIKVAVDSVSTTEINGQNLKKLHVTYFKIGEYEPEMYSSTIIEKMGDLKYMFNWNPWELIACDMNFPSGLRCYQDLEFGLYSSGIYESCTYTYEWTSVENESLNYEFKLFPNPSTGLINIHLETDTEITIEVFDVSGQTMFFKEDVKDKVVDISALQKGFYIVKVKCDNKIIGVKKIYKE